MKKILFLPLFRMRSGHHSVAESLMYMIEKYSQDITCKKIDLLSYTNESLEKIITNGYLKWIQYAPQSYNIAYKNFFYVQPSKEQTFKWYQPIFLKKMEQLISEEQPDLIVCTHGFPSYLLSLLKRNGKCHVPLINVYTDFFINNFWGRAGIDIHFLPSQEVKEKLMSKNHVNKQSLIVTGIPVHEEFMKPYSKPVASNRAKILIAGGNSGLGKILKLSNQLKKSSQFDYLILCGNNKKLFNEILSWQLDHVKPIPYLYSRKEMNKLYEEVDAIVTKPGGVTVSEALRKKLPIFVHSALPGQEEINLQYLKDQELVFELHQEHSFEKQLVDTLKDNKRMLRWERSIYSFLKGIEMEKPIMIVSFIEEMLNLNTSELKQDIVKKKKALKIAEA